MVSVVTVRMRRMATSIRYAYEVGCRCLPMSSRSPPDVLSFASQCPLVRLPMSSRSPRAIPAPNRTPRLVAKIAAAKADHREQSKVFFIVMVVTCPVVAGDGGDRCASTMPTCVSECTCSCTSSPCSPGARGSAKQRRPADQ